MRYTPNAFGVFQWVHDGPSLEGAGAGLAIVERNYSLVLGKNPG